MHINDITAEDLKWVEEVAESYIDSPEDKDAKEYAEMLLQKVAEAEAKGFRNIKIHIEHSYYDSETYMLKGQFLETKQEALSRKIKEEAVRRRIAEQRRAQFEQLKKEFGE